MLSTASVSTNYTGEAALRGETNDGEADSHCDGELEKEEENDEEENDEEDDRDEWDLNRAALLPCKAKLKMLGSLPFDFHISSQANFALKEQRGEGSIWAMPIENQHISQRGFLNHAFIPVTVKDDTDV